jgi:lipoprotein-releasing system permease protein
LNIASFIAKRIAFNREHSFSRFIIRLAITAASISVAAMILTLAFTNGFQYAISQKIFSFWGDIRVQHYENSQAAISEEYPIERNDTVLRILRANPEVTEVQAFATKYAIVKGKENLANILLKGVESDYDFGHLNVFLQRGRWLRFPDTGYSSEIDLSSYTANQLKADVGDRVVIYFIQPDGSPRARPMTIAGIFKTGIEEYDKLFALGDLHLLQHLNRWNDQQIGGYEIFLKDYRKMDTVNSLLFANLPSGWNSRTIRDLPQAAGIFDWLNLQDTTIAIVLIIMIIVAVLNLVTCLIILLLERTRMIGVLKALGSPNRPIQEIFLYQGMLISCLGLLFGNLLGLLICWLQYRYGFITLPEDAYLISKAEVRIEWWHLLLVDGGTLLICLLVLMIPTLIVQRLQPVEAIQFR